MKYLKLFENFNKETSDKLKEIEDKYLKDKNEVINQYKNTINEFLYDISDYPISANIELKDITINYQIQKEMEVKTPGNKYFLLCGITFTCDKYKSVLDNIKESVDRIKEAHNIESYLYRLDYIHPAGLAEGLITDKDFNRYEKEIEKGLKIGVTTATGSRRYDDSTKFKISILF